MPWYVETVEGRSVHLDFSSSGQGRVKAQQVWLDGHCFANQVASTSWAENEFQVAVCEACGYESCDSGGYVRVRSLQCDKLFVPCFDLMASEDAFESLHFSPPPLFRRLGIPVLADERWADLRRLVPRLVEPVPPISAREVALAYAFEAPRVFKPTAEGLALARGAFLATTVERSLGDVTAALESEWQKLLRDPAPVQARSLSPSDTDIGVILDDRQFTEWVPAVEDGDGRLRLRWGGWVL